MEVRGWPVGGFLREGPLDPWTGRIEATCQRKRFRFFEMRHLEFGFRFAGVFCEQKFELFSMIATFVEDWINDYFVTEHNRSGLKTVTAMTGEGKEYVAFLFAVPAREGRVYTIEGAKEPVDVLERAIEKFDEIKGRIAEEIALCFPERDQSISPELD